MDCNELNKKINEFTKLNYSAEEKVASQQALSQQELADLQNYLDQAGNVSIWKPRSIKSRLLGNQN